MKRHAITLASLAAAMLALAAAAGATSSQHATKAKSGGTLLFGAEREPTCLNLMLSPCGAVWAQMIESPVIRGAYVTQPNFTYKPDLVTGVRLQLHPERLTYHIRPEARWNDGKPVTAADFVFTWKTAMNQNLDIVSRAGYDLIASAKTVNPRTVTFTFKQPYADWKDMFSYVLPKHVLQGADFGSVWNDAIVNPKTGKPVSDGPFTLTSWKKGSQVTLVRNPRWWGPHKAYLNSIVFRFLTSSNTEIQQVRSGEVDAIYPQPQLSLAELRSAHGLVVRSSLGSNWEHIDIQQGLKGNPLAKNLWVRQALMLSINRTSALKALFGKLNSHLQPLNNVLYFNNFPQYTDHWGKWSYNPKKAASMLAAHGCKKGGDGIYSCNGTRLTFRFESTRGNQLRELAFTIIQDQLKKNGIEATDGFKPASVAFGQDLIQGNYDLFMFAWLGSPDPAGNTPIWSCPNAGGTQNYTNYCNRTVTKLLKQADTTLKAKARENIVNKADALMANDPPTIPLYQKPTFLVFHDYVKGMRDNPTNQSPAYNAQDWWLNK